MREAGSLRTCVSFLHVTCANNKETIGKEAVTHTPLALLPPKPRFTISVSVAVNP